MTKIVHLESRRVYQDIVEKMDEGADFFEASRAATKKANARRKRIIKEKEDNDYRML